MDQNSSIVCVSMGQAGVQMSQATWELFCLEHGLTCTGDVHTDTTNTKEINRIDVLFHDSSRKKYTARALIVDLDDTVVNEVRTGAFRELFHPDTMINGLEDAANNYARGHYTVGRCLSQSVFAELRKQAERCDRLQGFIMMNGVGGGTGSGFSALMAQNLSEKYSKCCRVMNSIYPGLAQSNCVVEPYNVTLSVKATIEDVDINITMDNEATYKVCQTRLKCPRPNYTIINRLMANLLNSITTSLRFEGMLNASLVQMQTNTVPYPRIHFPVINFAPVCSGDNFDHENLSEYNLISEVFSSESSFTSADLTTGMFMACSLLFRGNINQVKVNESMCRMKRSKEIQFVDWCPTGFKMGYCGQPVVGVPGSLLSPSAMCLTMLANSSAINTLWQSIHSKFQRLFQKRAFVHWYVGEGMEEGEMLEALEELTAIIQDYESCIEKTPKEEEEEKENAEESVPAHAPSEAHDGTEHTRHDETEQSRHDADEEENAPGAYANSDLEDEEDGAGHEQDAEDPEDADIDEDGGNIVKEEYDDYE